MDLFGEVCVTESDKELWLDSIKQLSKLPSRRAAYAKAYNIEEKIRTAKRNGWWPPNLENF
ncbi:MAG: hypothetical protein DID92_2727743025 [Candidatus Nitrotoga sp. SPKER]|nr:MAG: hypothetical protein DID92_2727743025 [Candidatus Nitrotoga sp. SPKER]